MVWIFSGFQKSTKTWCLWCSWVAVRPLESGAFWDAAKSPQACLWEEKGGLSLFLSLGFLVAKEPVAPSAMYSCNHDLTTVPGVTEPPGYRNLRNPELNKYSPLSSLSEAFCDSHGKLTVTVSKAKLTEDWLTLSQWADGPGGPSQGCCVLSYLWRVAEE